MQAHKNHAARVMREAIGNFRDGLLYVRWAYSKCNMCVLKLCSYLRLILPCGVLHEAAVYTTTMRTPGSSIIDEN